LPGNPEAVEAVNRVILDHLDWLRPPELRRALAAEALRHGAREALASCSWADSGQR
jgi:hypothetical protein